MAFRANDQFAQSIAARAGAGLALVPHYVGRSEPLLRLCDLGSAPPSRQVFMLTRLRDRQSPSIRAVAGEIARMFAQARDMFL